MALKGQKTLRKGMGSWWRDGYMCRSKSVLMKTKTVSHVFSTTLNGSVKLALECCYADKCAPAGDEDPAFDIQAWNEKWGRLGWVQEGVLTNNAWPADDVREERGKFWKTWPGLLTMGTFQS